MKRRAFKLLLFLLVIVGGAIINVAVAWGCVAWVWNPGRMDRMRNAFLRQSPTEVIRISREDSGGASLVFVSRVAGQHLTTFPEELFDGDVRSVVPRWINLDEPYAEYSAAVRSMGAETVNADDMLLGAGWPMRTLSCQLSRALVSGSDYLVGEMAVGGIPIGRQGTIDAAFRVLPLRPIWPGFAINTIFYAAIVYALFAVPGVRRRLRHKRGQCASCGYSLRESVSEKCPECGATV